MAKRSEKEIREEEILDMREVMSFQRGRRLVRRLISASGVYQSVMRGRPNVQPEERVLFNAAQRDFGLWILDEAMNANPTAFELMNSEAAAQKALERGME